MRHISETFSVSYKSQPPTYRFTTHCYHEVQLIIVTSGELLLEAGVQGHKTALCPGMFVLLRRRARFSLKCRRTGYRGIGIIARHTQAADLAGDPLYGLADNRLRAMEGLMTRHMDAPLPESEHILRGLGSAMLWEVLTLARERRKPRGPDWAEAARIALDLQLGAGVSVRAALSGLPLSYRQLCRCFHDHFGVTLKAYQNLTRIQEACRLLTATDMDITAIASELGFSSSQHLATRFRRVMGCAPGKYRQGGRDIP